MIYLIVLKQSDLFLVKMCKLILYSCITLFIWTSCNTNSRLSQNLSAQRNDIEKLSAAGFQKISKLPFDLKDVSPLTLQFIDENYGWISTKGQVLRTNDGGVTWQTIFRDKEKNKFNDKLKLLDLKKGWVVSNNRVYRIDGNEDSWQEIILPNLPPFALFHNIEFSSNKLYGWISGEFFEKLAPDDTLPNRLLSSDGKHGARPLIYFTKDGGRSWQNQNISIPDYGSIVKVISSNNEMALAIATPDILLFNSISWQPVKSDLRICDSASPLMSLPYANLTDVFEPCSVYFSDSEFGWIAYTNGQLAESKDSGKTWCAVSHTLSEWPKISYATYSQKIQFADKQHGWWLIEHNLFSTKNAGRSWLMVSESVDDFSIINNNQIIILQDLHLWKGSAKTG